MPAEKDSRTAPTPKRRAARHEPTRPVLTPVSVRRVAAIGIPISLVASAAVSFQGLTGLGSLVGISHPWLLPISIDVYAVTSTLIAMLLPESHLARRTAVWNARLGLAMSMAGNAAFRSIHLGSYTATDIVLTFVGAWPSLIVERLLHLQGRLADSTVLAAAVTDTDTPTPETTVPRARKADTARRTAVTDTPSPTPDTVTPAVTAPVIDTTPTPDTVTGRPTPALVTAADIGSSDTDSGHAERSLPWWAEKAAPLYRQWMRDHNGTTPTAPMLADLLIKAGHDVPAGEVQRRKIRRETENYITEHPEPEPEPERVGATS